MKNVALTAPTVAFLSATFAGVMLLTACGGGDGKVVLPDAAVQIDGGNGVCDVLMGTGCAADEKCSFIFDKNATGDLPSVCIKAGSVQEGGTCSYTMYDSDANLTADQDCAKGLQCFRGACSKVCPEQAFSCDDKGMQTCRVFSGIWADQPTRPTDGIGFCVDQCDPLEQTVCRNNPGGAIGSVEGCNRKFYVEGQNIVDIDFACVPIDESIATQTAAGQACDPIDGSDCFLNYAPRGTTLLFTGVGNTSVVAPYCRFQEAHADAAAGDVRGDPAKILNSDPMPRDGNCSTSNFLSGGNNAAGKPKWECRSFDEFAVFSVLAGATKAEVIQTINGLNDGLDLPSGVGLCSDTELVGKRTQAGADEILYPTMKDYSLAAYQTDLGDGKYDETGYKNCWDCLTGERWLEVTQAVGAIIGNAVKHVTRTATRVKMIAPVRPLTLEETKRLILQ